MATKGNWSELRDLLALDLPHTEMLVLLALRIRQGENSCCWPSQATIAADTGLSERSVRTITTALVERNLIRVARLTKVAGRPKAYSLNRQEKVEPIPEAASATYRQLTTKDAATVSYERKRKKKEKEELKGMLARLADPTGLRAPSSEAPSLSAQDLARLRDDPQAFWAHQEALASKAGA